MLIHCGDMFNMFSPGDDDLERMDEWFGNQSFDLILELQQAWAAIPPGVDVLMTHSPPAGILDVSSRKPQLGCGHLAARLPDRWDIPNPVRRPRY